MAVGRKTLAPPGQYFVRISLMAYVPDDAVVRRVEHVMQRHDQLHSTQARRKMPRVARQLVDDVTAQLAAHLRQQLRAQAPQVRRAVYPVK